MTRHVFPPNRVAFLILSSAFFTPLPTVFAADDPVKSPRHTKQVVDAAFSPDGRQLVTASRDRTSILWDVTTGRPLHVLKGHAHIVITAVFHPDGKRLATGGADGRVLLWETATGRKLHELTFEDTSKIQADVLAFSSDGRSLVGGGYRAAATIWDVETGRRLRTLRQQLTLFERLNNEVPKVRAVSFSPNRRQILTASSKNLSVWDAAPEAKPVPTWTSDAAYVAAFSPDGRLIAANVDDALNPKAVVVDAGTGKVLATLDIDEAHLWFIAFSPDGRQIATASFNKPPRILDASSGKLIHLLDGHTSAVHVATISPDGRTIVTAANDNTAILWDSGTGAERFTLRGHLDLVTQARFSPDGRTVVTVSGDTTAVLWDVETGRRIHVLGQAENPE